MSRFHRNTLVLGLAVLLALPLVAPTPATAGTERYTAISTFPYTISTPGGYKLSSNIVASVPIGTLITIACDNVTLDFDGFTLSSTASSPVFGITSSGFSNITIRNGTLRRMATGIGINQGKGIVIEDMTLMDTVEYPISIGHAYGAIVRRCNVVNTGSMFTVTGIRVSGTSAYVLDNVITKINHSSIAIDMTGCQRSVVERNIITNDPGDFYYGSTGIKFSGAVGTAVGNRIANFGTGISMTNGIYYRDNFVQTFFIAGYVGGTDAGNNY